MDPAKASFSEVSAALDILNAALTKRKDDAIEATGRRRPLPKPIVGAQDAMMHTVNSSLGLPKELIGHARDVADASAAWPLPGKQQLQHRSPSPVVAMPAAKVGSEHVAVDREGPFLTGTRSDATATSGIPRLRSKIPAGADRIEKQSESANYNEPVGALPTARSRASKAKPSAKRPMIPVDKAVAVLTAALQAVILSAKENSNAGGGAEVQPQQAQSMRVNQNIINDDATGGVPVLQLVGGRSARPTSATEHAVASGSDTNGAGHTSNPFAPSWALQHTPHAGPKPASSSSHSGAEQAAPGSSRRSASPRAAAAGSPRGRPSSAADSPAGAASAVQRQLNSSTVTPGFRLPSARCATSPTGRYISSVTQKRLDARGSNDNSLSASASASASGEDNSGSGSISRGGYRTGIAHADSAASPVASARTYRYSSNNSGSYRTPSSPALMGSVAESDEDDYRRTQGLVLPSDCPISPEAADILREAADGTLGLFGCDSGAGSALNEAQGLQPSSTVCDVVTSSDNHDRVPVAGMRASADDYIAADATPFRDRIRTGPPLSRIRAAPANGPIGHFDSNGLPRHHPAATPISVTVSEIGEALHASAMTPFAADADSGRGAMNAIVSNAARSMSELQPQQAGYSQHQSATASSVPDSARSALDSVLSEPVKAVIQPDARPPPAPSPSSATALLEPVEPGSTAFSEGYDRTARSGVGGRPNNSVIASDVAAESAVGASYRAFLQQLGLHPPQQQTAYGVSGTTAAAGSAALAETAPVYLQAAAYRSGYAAAGAAERVNSTALLPPSSIPFGEVLKSAAAAGSSVRAESGASPFFARSPANPAVASGAYPASPFFSTELSASRAADGTVAGFFRSQQQLQHLSSPSAGAGLGSLSPGSPPPSPPPSFLAAIQPIKTLLADAQSRTRGATQQQSTTATQHYAAANTASRVAQPGSPFLAQNGHIPLTSSSASAPAVVASASGLSSSPPPSVWTRQQSPKYVSIGLYGQAATSIVAAASGSRVQPDGSYASSPPKQQKHVHEIQSQVPANSEVAAEKASADQFAATRQAAEAARLRLLDFNLG